MTRRAKPNVRPNTKEQQIARRIENGERFFHVCCNGTTLVFLAQNSTQAFGMFNLIYSGQLPQCDIGQSDGCVGIVEISSTMPIQFAMFVGRRAGTAQVELISF